MLVSVAMRDDHRNLAVMAHYHKLFIVHIYSSLKNLCFHGTRCETALMASARGSKDILDFDARCSIPSISLETECTAPKLYLPLLTGFLLDKYCKSSTIVWTRGVGGNAQAQYCITEEGIRRKLAKRAAWNFQTV